MVSDILCAVIFPTELLLPGLIVGEDLAAFFVFGLFFELLLLRMLLAAGGRLTPFS